MKKNINNSKNYIICNTLSINREKENTHTIMIIHFIIIVKCYETEMFIRVE